MNAVEIISTLRGTPITLFLLLLSLGGQSGIKELAATSGYSQPTVRTGIQRLKQYGLVSKTNRYDGWMLTTAGMQLTFGISREKNFFLSSSSSINLIESKEEDLTTTTSKEILSPDVYKLLKEKGVGNPKRTELAQMDHVTLEYAKAHLGSGKDLALIIWRMERNHDAPELKAVSSFKPCTECNSMYTHDGICEDCENE